MNLIRGNNSDALVEDQSELEWRFAHLGEEERQTLMPVMILGQGMPCLLRRILMCTICTARGDEESV